MDTIPPLIAAPEDIILEAQNPIGEQVVLGTASASDVVGISEITNDAPENISIWNHYRNMDCHGHFR